MTAKTQKDAEEPVTQWLCKLNAEPSLLELSRVAIEEDKVNVQPAFDECQ